MKWILNFALLLILFGILINCVGFQSIVDDASKSRYSQQYQNKLDEGSTLVKAWYHYSVEKTPSGKYIYKQYFPSTGQLTDYQTYKDKYLISLDGLFKQWRDDGTPLVEFTFKNGKKEGFSKSYIYAESGLVGNYRNDLKEGEWKELDSLGNISAVYNYLNDERHGIFKVFDENGKIEEEGEYKNGELLFSSAPPIDTTVVEKMPVFYSKLCKGLKQEEKKKCGDKQLLQKIYKRIKYPAFAREMGIQGTSIVQFVIEKDGEISDIRCLRCICKEIKSETLRVVRLLDKWEPGYQNGEPVRVQFNLPIKYRLE